MADLLEMTHDYFRSTRATNGIVEVNRRRHRSKPWKTAFALVTLVFALAVLSSPWIELQITKLVTWVDESVAEDSVYETYKPPVSGTD